MIETDGTWVGRVWRDRTGPSIVTVRDGVVLDVTSREIPTLSSLVASPDPVAKLHAATGETLGPVDDQTWLAPADLQAIKAAGVTFAKSMVERVIEERAAGDPTKAEAIRAQVTAIIGDSLSTLVPGSEKAEAVKQTLIKEGMWSQYLEVGIGPYAEVFTKCQPLAAVGTGASIGLHPESIWNNPEPEVVVAVSPKGRIVGATLGNDVNLRDFEGRSALLLSKAKDNNASTAIGPMIRLFDESYGIADVCQADLTLRVDGPDGYTLHGTSTMREISRAPEDIVAQSIGAHHQYPDGFLLFLGTLFAPTEDRDVPGEGFTHKIGDLVTISCPGLGTLTNTVATSDTCPPWEFGLGALMTNLAGRNLL